MMLLPCSSDICWNSCARRLFDDVDERADGFDGDADLVAWLQSKLVGRDDARPRQKEAALRERVVAEEKFDERFGRTLELRKRRLTREDRFAGALDAQLDLGGGGEHFFHDKNTRAERTAPVIDLGLRQVERVRAFYVTRTHVIADGVADDLP